MISMLESIFRAVLVAKLTISGSRIGSEVSGEVT